MVFRMQDYLRFSVHKFDFQSGFQPMLWEANILELIEKDDDLLRLLLDHEAIQFIQHRE
jgi:hypothetical protein